MSSVPKEFQIISTNVIVVAMVIIISRGHGPQLHPYHAKPSLTLGFADPPPPPPSTEMTGLQVRLVLLLKYTCMHKEFIFIKSGILTIRWPITVQGIIYGPVYYEKFLDQIRNKSVFRITGLKI